MISIVCVYNNERVFKDVLLRSLENQTSKHELILIDNTQGKFNSAAEALNWGGGKAKGKYIMFVHQDVDLCSNPWLENTEKLLNSIPNLGIAGVAGARSSKTSSNLERITNIQHGIPAINVRGAIPLQKPEKVQTVDECLVIIPRPVFDRLHFDEKVCDDWHLYTVDYSLGVALLGLGVYVIPAFVYHMSIGIPRSSIMQIILSRGLLDARFYKTIGKLLKKYRSHTKQVYTTSGLWRDRYPLALQRVNYLPAAVSAVYYESLATIYTLYCEIIVKPSNMHISHTKMDTINGCPLVERGSPIIIDVQQEQMITVSGWVVDKDAGKAAGSVSINIDGQIDVPALYGLDRHDVARFSKNSRYKRSGFWACFATSTLSAGQHILSLKVVTVDKKEYYNLKQKIILEVR